MRSILQKSTKPYGLVIAISSLLVLILGIGLATRVHAESATPSADQHLLTIHENGQERGILTRDSTLRQALKNAHIAIDPSDMVEPGLDDPLIAGRYEVNIYRARPVTIIDGTLRKKVMSAYQTPKQIVQHAAMTLRDEDITTVGASTDLVADGAGLQLTIKRATPVTFVLYGKQVAAYTQAKTVGEMLNQKGVKLGKDDTVSTDARAPISAGMTIEVWRNGKQTVTEEQQIAFPVQQIKDADQPTGYKNVKTPGVNGTKEVTYEIEMQNGKEVSRHEIQSVTSKEPVEQIEVIGTKSVLPPGSHQDWMAAAGISSSDYGYVEYIVNHEGGWEPCKVQGGAINCSYGGSMGYGIVQATPGSKMVSAGDDWRTNPITQLRWATGYAVGRYGSWSGAYNHWLASHNW